MGRIVPSFSLRTLVLVALFVASAIGVWINRAPWTLKYKLIDADQGQIACAAFSADSKRLIALNESGVLRTWDVSSGRMLDKQRRTLAEVKCFGEGPNGPVVVQHPIVGGEDKSKLNTATVSDEPSDEQWKNIISFEFPMTPLNDALANVNRAMKEKTTLRLCAKWDPAELPESFSFMTRPSPAGSVVKSVAELMHGRVFFAGTQAIIVPERALLKMCVLSDLATGTVRSVFVDGHDEEIHTISMSADGQRVLTESWNKMCLWNIDGQLLSKWPRERMTPHSLSINHEWILRAGLSNDSTPRFRAEAGHFGKPPVYETKSGTMDFGEATLNSNWRDAPSEGLYEIASCSKDGKYVLVAYNTATNIFDAKTLEHLAILRENIDYLGCLFPAALHNPARFSHDNRYIIAEGCKLWERNRPEQWWGFFWLPFTWFVILLFGALVLSLLRDRRQKNIQA